MCTVTVLALAVSARADITVKGSDTMIILAQKWAEVYMAKYRDVKLQVTGSGSGIGIAALLNRGTDVATASRPMKPAEIAQCLRLFGRRPTEYKVALDGLTVYVHESNPVKDLSLDQFHLTCDSDDGLCVAGGGDHGHLPERIRPAGLAGDARDPGRGEQFGRGAFDCLWPVRLGLLHRVCGRRPGPANRRWRRAVLGQARAAVGVDDVGGDDAAWW